MCAMGFVCRAFGVQARDLLDKFDPLIFVKISELHNVSEYQKIINKIMKANDELNVPMRERERTITDLGKKIYIKFSFK